MGRTKWDFEKVKNFFEEQGCTLLSTEYVRAKDKLSYVCNCGNESEISFDKFRSGQRCRGCKFTRGAAKQRYTIEYLKQFFANNGCELLTDDYENNKDKLKYRCSCGNEAFISFAKFQAGQRCRKCARRKISEKNRKENAKNWDINRTDADRIRDRRYPEYYEWRRQVFERDNYTCQVCGLRGATLNAHHIQGFAEHESLRTDVNNGVTLCVDCHKTYHSEIEHNKASLAGWEYYTNEFLEPPFAGEVEDDAYFEYLESTEH